jgi:GntR family transcriptional regulator
LQLSEVVIDKDSIIPIYYQLIQYIKAQIEKGLWKENDIVPSERELCEKFQISRMTVRQALESLVNEGVLYRKRGIGTFIAKPKVDQGLTRLTNFTTDMLSRGMEPGSKTLETNILNASEEIAQKLGIKQGEKVIELCRLRLANGEPMAMERAFLVYDMAYMVLQESMENKSLYAILREKCNLNIVSAKETIEIAYSNQEVSHILGIKQASPIFLIKRVACLDNQHPIEYVESFYRADRYKFSVELRL